MEIKDLILPNSNTAVDITIRQQVEDYLDKNMTPAMRKAYNHIDGDILSIVMNFIDDLKAIKDQVIKENKVNYNKEYRIKVAELNKEKLAEINCFINFALNGVELYFKHLDQRNYTPHFKFHEIELINEQYRLLQKIYYSRLEAENE